MERANLIDARPTVSDMLPWKIQNQHKTTAVMERFRTISKQKNGLDTTAEEERLLDNWLRGLADNDVIVNYHPDAPPNDASSKGGFYYVPRAPEDTWIVRLPSD